jgi:hypothetical protein
MYLVTVRVRMAGDPGWEHNLESDFEDAAKRYGYNDGSRETVKFDVAIRTVHAFLKIDNAAFIEDAVRRAVRDVIDIVSPCAGAGLAVLAVNAEAT